MSEREDTFLIAVTRVGADSRTAARRDVYDQMGRVLSGGYGIDGWFDATVDYVANHDNGEAVWAHPGRGIEAQHALVLAGLAPETDDAIGPHPQVYVARDGDREDGGVLVYECVRCGNGSDHPAVLAEVPCEDVAKWEHSHYWVAVTDWKIACISDCGMTVKGGRFIGEISAEAAGSPPD
jgi:hypothetical protein